MRSTHLLVGLMLAAAPYGDEIPAWQTDWEDAAFQTARERHRLVLVNYTAGWCGKCHDVERLTLRDPQSRADAPRAQTLAPPNSCTYADAGESVEHLH